MNKAKIVRVICNILIAVLLLGFVISLLWYMTDSLEMMPTQEQTDKARLSAALCMAVFGLACALCVAVRVKYRKCRRALPKHTD
ncbi:MAG: hypothetical protein IJ391_07485 [Clostridia bacterium]|nr:hypothetical protein [Clostridia bacterium]